ncbi:DUF1992 domain-containing protein [Gemmobacter nectariphilus]|uniref:DnaJ family domain-containing protein n=1 Tax=Gemmobacter nectariphilus TaxID=220343 RepID=UPI00041D13A2|nr:DUF1992 domain-containing protein [Gemmobacter nectariphilus]
MKFSQLAERQIRKAQAEGQLENLKGAGKPLDLSEAAGSTEAIGFRIMAEAGAVPREVDLRRQVQAQQAILQQTTDPEARKREMARLADLQLRLEIEAEARRRFQRS